MDSFKNFHPIIEEWFTHTYGSPSPPQILGWPAIAANKHALILAPTGSGKTLAAFLWAINDLFKSSLREDHERFKRNARGVHTLYISPLKALNNDIARNLDLPLAGIRQMAAQRGLDAPQIRVLVRTGDTPQSIRNTIVTHPPHILITTPESLYLLLTSRRGRLIFNHLRYLIVDEIHALCAGKRGVHLSLTLERLAVLTGHDPVRIGLSATQRPLERIAQFLGGFRFDRSTETFEARPVEILDCGHKRELDVRVVTPVARFGELDDDSVWPAVIERLYKLITTHKTTLIFANMRAQTERLARQLNDLHHQRSGGENDPICLPHHGSMSREKRYEVETRLKAGTIPAVVATASLELGIDIGSIDLVVQLEAPRTVASGLQRIGRSGHLISLKSKGRIIPLYPADLDDAAATVTGMIDGEIEETVIPENCIDVLAQQIVAETAMQKWTATNLYQTCRQSYCYQSLTRPVFDQVLEMLTGRYADTRLPALQPIIAWDRTTDTLIARRSARIQAVMNGGTIPDRGYYTVMLADEKIRLGEMEEEFVFESRIGDIFYLGNSEWRIDDIRQDRIIVSSYASAQPREPFWKGEIPYRDYQTSLRVGRFRSQLMEYIDLPDPEEKLLSEFAIDRASADNLVIYFKRQREITGRIPTDSDLIAEWFHDAANEINLILHAPFGGRVLGLWAMALAARLESLLGTQIQYTCNDDALMIRIREMTGAPPIQELLDLHIDEIDGLIRDKISSAPVFSVIFRYNAGRALLLARSRPGQRIPLWVQRLRASDLLQAIRHRQDFPILLETYRSCLQDVFDLHALHDVLHKLQDGRIGTHIIRTPYPSPMASGLLFNFVASQMYEMDRSREPARVASVSTDLLAQMMDTQEIPAILTTEIIDDNVQKWQYQTSARRPRDIEELYLMIEALGPVSRDEILGRTGAGMAAELDTLAQNGRITKHLHGWIASSRAHHYQRPADRRKQIKQLQYFMETRGPEKAEDISSALGFDPATTRSLLQDLLKQRQIVRGRLLENSPDEFFCDRNNFAQLYRQAVALRRRQTVAIGPADYLQFQLQWHFREGPVDALHRYRGLRMPYLHLEREILSARSSKALHDVLPELRRMISDGELIISFEPDTPYIRFMRRGEGWLMQFNGFGDHAPSDSEILNFLKENGASFLDDMEAALQIPRRDIITELRTLTLAGLISCENYDTLLSFGSRSKPPARTRAGARKQARDSMIMGTGRWFRLDTFGVLGRKPERSDVAVWQARLLLQRYGILVKEFYRFEHGLLPWYEIFQALKKLEWQGEIRRGYFAAGLSGIQFALPEAVEMLARGRKAPGPCRLINVPDPALPFGANLPWPVDIDQTILRQPGNHIGFSQGRPIVYTENFFTRWFTAQQVSGHDLDGIIMLTKNWLKMPEPFRPKRKIVVEHIDRVPAGASPLVAAFQSAGYEQDGTSVILWPSAL